MNELSDKTKLLLNLIMEKKSANEKLIYLELVIDNYIII